MDGTELSPSYLATQPIQLKFMNIIGNNDHKFYY